MTVEEQKVLKKAYNDKYREKKKLFKKIKCTHEEQQERKRNGLDFSEFMCPYHYCSVISG